VVLSGVGNTNDSSSENTFCLFVRLAQHQSHSLPNPHNTRDTLSVTSVLISGSSLTSGELDRSRLTRFELGAAARAVLHAAHLSFRLPWGQPLHAKQSLFRLP
jgi:hypothetical protein